MSTSTTGTISNLALNPLPLKDRGGGAFSLTRVSGIGAAIAGLLTAINPAWNAIFAKNTPIWGQAGVHDGRRRSLDRRGCRRHPRPRPYQGRSSRAPGHTPFRQRSPQPIREASTKPAKPLRSESTRGRPTRPSL